MCTICVDKESTVHMLTINVLPLDLRVAPRNCPPLNSSVATSVAGVDPNAFSVSTEAKYYIENNCN